MDKGPLKEIQNKLAICKRHAGLLPAAPKSLTLDLLLRGRDDAVRGIKMPKPQSVEAAHAWNVLTWPKCGELSV